MDPPNVLWFAGAYAIALGSYALLQTLPDTHKSVWILLAAIAFLLALRRHGAPPPAQSILVGARGLAAALAVAMVPAVCIGFLRLIGVWSSDFPLTDINGSAVAVAFVTAAAGLIAYWLTRFSFLFAIVVGAISSLRNSWLSRERTCNGRRPRHSGADRGWSTRDRGRVPRRFRQAT